MRRNESYVSQHVSIIVNPSYLIIVTITRDHNKLITSVIHANFHEIKKEKQFTYNNNSVLIGKQSSCDCKAAE